MTPKPKPSWPLHPFALWAQIKARSANGPAARGKAAVAKARAGQPAKAVAALERGVAVESDQKAADALHSKQPPPLHALLLLLSCQNVVATLRRKS